MIELSLSRLRRLQLPAALAFDDHHVCSTFKMFAIDHNCRASSLRNLHTRGIFRVRGARKHATLVAEPQQTVENVNARFARVN